MWDLPGPGIKPLSPALAGRLLTTAPPGESLKTFFRHEIPQNFPLFSLSENYWKCLLKWGKKTREQKAYTDPGNRGSSSKEEWGESHMIGKAGGLPGWQLCTRCREQPVSEQVRFGCRRDFWERGFDRKPDGFEYLQRSLRLLGKSGHKFELSAYWKLNKGKDTC